MPSPIKRKFLGYGFYYAKGSIRFRVDNKSYEHLKEQIINRNTGWVNCYKLAGLGIPK